MKDTKGTSPFHSLVYICGLFAKGIDHRVMHGFTIIINFGGLIPIGSTNVKITHIDISTV